MDKIQHPDPAKRIDKLFQSGKLVQVHVSKWSMTTAANENDLGLPKEDVSKLNVPKFVTIGKKALFTDNVRLVFQRIESSARTYLLNNSHKFPIADAHFVPQKMLQKVMTELDGYRAKYLEEIESFIGNYEKHKKDMFEAYPEFKANLEPYYPPVDVVRRKFDFSISVYEVAFPRKVTKVTAQEIIAQNIAAQAAAEKYEILMKEQYQQQLHQMDNFLKESVQAMRGEVIKTFEVIALKIQGREVVSASNLKTLKSTIESFDALDFLNDEKVKATLAQVKKLISSGLNFKDDEEARERLGAAIKTTLETARSITDIDTLTGEYTRRLDEEL